MEHFRFKPQQNQGAQSLSPSTSPSDAVWIAQRIAVLLSAYRRDDYQNPEMFVMQLGQILAKYSPEIVAYVTDPMTGIQRKVKFPPSIAEVVEACEARVTELAKIERYRSMGAVRTRIARTPGAPPGQSYEEMFAKHKRPTGVFEEGRQLPYSATSPKS